MWLIRMAYSKVSNAGAPPRHRSDPRLSVRRRLPGSGPERRAAELPDLLLPVRGGRRGADPCGMPFRCEAVHRCARQGLDSMESAQRPSTGFRDGPARDAAVVRLGECAERLAARVVVREEVFPFHAGITAEGVTDFMADARLVIDEPTVLPQVISHVTDLHLEQVGTETKSDLFKHVLRQIRQAGELGQFRTPRHVIRTMASLSILVSAKPSTTRPPARRGSWSARTTTSGSRTRQPRALRRSRRTATPCGVASATR